MKVLGHPDDGRYDFDPEAIVKQAKKYHPDVYIGDKSFAEEKMKAINEAYSVLSDSDKRSAYDSFLKSKKTEQIVPRLQLRYITTWYI